MRSSAANIPGVRPASCCTSSCTSSTCFQVWGQSETLMSQRVPRPVIPFLLFFATACGGTAYEESSANSEEASRTVSEALTLTETGGLLSMESENYTTSQGGKSWTPCASDGGICATCGNGTC